jgi:hypothetical protein
VRISVALYETDYSSRAAASPYDNRLPRLFQQYYVPLHNTDDRDSSFYSAFVRLPIFGNRNRLIPQGAGYQNIVPPTGSTVADKIEFEIE